MKYLALFLLFLTGCSFNPFDSYKNKVQMHLDTLYPNYDIVWIEDWIWKVPDTITIEYTGEMIMHYARIRDSLINVENPHNFEQIMALDDSISKYNTIHQAALVHMMEDTVVIATIVSADDRVRVMFNKQITKVLQTIQTNKK